MTPAPAVERQSAFIGTRWEMASTVVVGDDDGVAAGIGIADAPPPFVAVTTETLIDAKDEGIATAATAAAAAAAS